MIFRCNSPYRIATSAMNGLDINTVYVSPLIFVSNKKQFKYGFDPQKSFWNPPNECSLNPRRKETEHTIERKYAGILF